jgi:hypothetical protein
VSFQAIPEDYAPPAHDAVDFLVPGADLVVIHVQPYTDAAIAVTHVQAYRALAGADQAQRYHALAGADHAQRYHALAGVEHIQRYTDRTTTIVHAQPYRALSGAGHVQRYTDLTTTIVHAQPYRALAGIGHVQRYTDATAGVTHDQPYRVFTGADRMGRWEMLPLEARPAADRRGRWELLPLEARPRADRFSPFGIQVAAERRFRQSALRVSGRDRLTLWTINAPVEVDRATPFMILELDPVSVDRFAPFSMAVVEMDRFVPWGDLSPVSAERFSPWGGMIPVEAERQTFWSILPLVVADRFSPFAMTSPSSVDRQARFEILDHDPVVVDRRAIFSIHSGDVRLISDQPSLIHQGRRIPIARAEVRADDGSHVWLADITLTRPADYARIRLGDPIQVDLYGEIFRLFVDQRHFSHSEYGAVPDLRISGISPLAARGLPYAAPLTWTWAGPVDAYAVVTELIGSVAWSLPHWSIPAGRVAIEGGDPLTLARAIVAAAGGVIDSHPDGSVTCRPRYPVSVPDWRTTTPAHDLTDEDVVSVSESHEYLEFFDRVAISDVPPAVGGLDVEYEQDETDRYRGTLRAYPVPWTALTASHSGDGAVSLSPRGAMTRTEEELVDIVDGYGTTRYPIWSVVSTKWQYRSLGTVSFDQGSREVATSLPGTSLLRIKYRTQAQEWAAADPRDEEILAEVIGG